MIGLPLQLPATGPPPGADVDLYNKLVGKLEALEQWQSLTKKAKWSYYQNVCTQSYSMWWYAWEDWERNLDWAALWGVNLVLAYTGQEKIFRDVFNGG